MSHPQRDVLAHLRVLDISQLLPGPCAAQILGDLGARVIKVEPPQGDGGRQILGGLFSAANRNKRSLALDLKSEVGRADFFEVARAADVIIEGYRPGVVDRLGIGYAQVAAVHPKIVYCSVSGYGQDGVNSRVPGHDINYLAASGALSFPGHWGEKPRRPGVPMADVAAASYAVIAILAALGERDRTHRGCHLDVSMTDVMSAWAAVRGGARLERSADDRRHLYPTNDIFMTKDERWLAVGAVEERFWEGLKHALSTDEPRLTDRRFVGLEGRLEHGDEIQSLLSEVFARHSLESWIARFKNTDVPVSAVQSLEEVADRQTSTGRGIMQEVDGERHIVFPVRMDGVVMGRLRSKSPVLGDSGAVLRRGDDAWQQVNDASVR